MHLLESYALVSGCKIDHPFIKTQKINIPSKPYVLIHSCNQKGSDRQYKSWNSVVNMLKNNNQFNREIYQIGQRNDVKLDNINHQYLGELNYNELAYLIEHCELLLCFDSFPMHLASVFDKKIVAVFGKYPQNSEPYFGSKKNQIILVPSFDKYKPCFNNTFDKNDLINKINAKAVYRAAIKLLKINKSPEEVKQ